jgi:hypothetical protein
VRCRSRRDLEFAMHRLVVLFIERNGDTLITR